MANNGAGTAQAFDATGQAQATSVTISVPTGTAGPAAPTGEVFNDTSGFPISANGQTGPAQFLFATQQGTIAGFNSTVDPANAVTVVDNSATGAVYTGLATGTVNGAPVIYAANFHNRKIDVFDSSFSPVTLTSAFSDPRIPRRFAPFGVANINGQIFVSYARQDAQARSDVPGAGRGFVDVFTLDGVLVQRLIQRGQLNAPWGMTLASANFGQFSNDLLVGNVGDGTINAFNPSTGTFIGTLQNSSNAPIRIDGLLGLSFGNSATGATDSLFFTAGLGGAMHGLFGLIRATSVPSIPATVIPPSIGGPVYTGATAPQNTPLPQVSGLLTGPASDILGGNSTGLLG